MVIAEYAPASCKTVLIQRQCAIVKTFLEKQRADVVERNQSARVVFAKYAPASGHDILVQRQRTVEVRRAFEG